MPLLALGQVIPSDSGALAKPPSKPSTGAAASSGSGLFWLSFRSCAITLVVVPPYPLWSAFSLEAINLINLTKSISHGIPQTAMPTLCTLQCNPRADHDIDPTVH